MSTPETSTSPDYRGRKAAVDAFCRQCIYDKHAPGTWRQQVESCTSLNCPLYSFRPVSATAADDAE